MTGDLERHGSMCTQKEVFEVRTSAVCPDLAILSAETEFDGEPVECRQFNDVIVTDAQGCQTNILREPRRTARYRIVKTEERRAGTALLGKLRIRQKWNMAKEFMNHI